MVVTVNASEEGRCEFCREQSGVARRAEIDAHLGSTSRITQVHGITVFPSVSPLAPGHLLLAPVRHVRSTKECVPAEVRAVSAALDWTRSLLADRDAIVSFEHGVGATSSAGCGIVHAHIHVLPLPSEVRVRTLRRLMASLTLLARGTREEVCAALRPGQSYLMFGEVDDQVAFDGENVSSQLVRKIACEHLGQSWDWRLFDRWAQFDESLRILNVGIHSV
ncbi:HIT domain-containing protein [Nocardia sp. NPDC006044]|uniref:HIT domain-containing protein n=1 Tax=Nocardia sp. NPDC006044 TaxID=3364306 RepID=UPI0036A07A9B